MSTEGQMIETKPMTKEEMDLIMGAYQANVDAKAEVKIHRVAICQPGSPEVAGGLPGYKAGMLVDNKTREILTAEVKQPWMRERGVPEAELSTVHCMAMVVCMKLPTEFMKWIPTDDRKPTDPLPYEFKTLDGSDPRVRAGVWANRGGTFGKHESEQGKAPPVTDNINFLIQPLHPETFTPRGSFIVDTFARTSAAAGQDLTTYIQGHGMVNLPPWGQIYYVWMKKEFNQEKNSTYYVQKVVPGPLLSAKAPQLEPMIRSMALWLADKTFGKSRQETMLNMAEIDDNELAGVGGGNVGNTVDGTASVNPLGGGDDPFAGGSVDSVAPTMLGEKAGSEFPN